MKSFLLSGMESNSLRGGTPRLRSHSPFQRLCRNAGIHGPGLKIPRGHGTEAKHRSFADVHPGQTDARAHTHE